MFLPLGWRGQVFLCSVVSDTMGNFFVMSFEFEEFVRT